MTINQTNPLSLEGVTQAIAKAIAEADASFGYSFNLTRLVDGEETHTLKMSGFDPVDFEDREDGYRLLEERRNKVRADAVLAAIQAFSIPSVGGWRSIESAPKDGTFVDLWAFWPESGEGRRTPDAYWNGRNWQLGQYNEAQFMFPPSVTHWMPLPSPPKALLSSEEGIC